MRRSRVSGGLPAALSRRQARAPSFLALALLLACAPYSALGLFTCTRQDTTCAALGDFWEATGGPGWQNRSGWEQAAAGVATDYCSFACLVCDAAGVLRQLCVSCTLRH